MIHEWMLYTFVVTMLFAWAAWALEDIAISRGWPTRLIWIGAVLGSLLLPQTLHLRPERQPSVTISLRGVTTPIAPAQLQSVAPSTSTLSPSEGAVIQLERLESRVKTGWIAMSGLALIVFAISFVVVAVRRRGWSSRVIRRRRVWISADTGPAVVGFFPGEIVLPDWMLSSPPSDAKLAVAHEEEHIRAHDPVLVLAIAVACVAMPWNLPLWFVARRLRRAIELDCDRRVLLAGVDARTYGKLLIEVTERRLARHLVVTALSVSPFLEKRLRLILQPKPQSSLRFGAMTMTASVFLLLASSLNPPDGQAEEPSGESRELRTIQLNDAVEIFQVSP